MARIQILELPAGAADERPPFALVIDQCQPQRYMLDPDHVDQFVGPFDGVAEQIGARAVLVFAETIDIPDNDVGRQVEPLLHVGGFEGDEEILRLTEERDELHAEIGLAHGQLHSAALSAIRSKHANIRELIERAEQAEAERDDARNWARHGYEIGQRHCGWSDHGVAPVWLTEGWPRSFDSCEHAKQAAEYDTALSRVRSLAERWLYTGDRKDGPLKELRQALDGEATVCCGCGGRPVVYRNYREQPFCGPCANGEPRKEPDAAPVETVGTALAVLVLDTLGLDLTEGQPVPALALDNACRQLVKSEAARKHMQAERTAMRASLREALGLDNDEGIDVLAAARDMRHDLGQSREAIRSVVHLHRGESHKGQAICVECSAYDGWTTTGNPPVTYPCDTAKRIWEANGEAGAPEDAAHTEPTSKENGA